MLTLLFLPALATATTYYVDDGGNDSNNGLSASSAWKTISHAAGIISGGTAADPDILIILAGTYNPANGETFPIIFSGNYINLVGAGAASVTINASANTALQMNGKGVQVSGCTFQNGANGIAFAKGGFTVTDNVFTSTVNRGITFIRSDPGLSSSVSYGDMSISNNTFQVSSDGVTIEMQEIFDGSTGGLTATIGSLSITGNTFNVSGRGVYIPVVTISQFLNGTATMGTVTVSDNNFTGGNTGIEIGSSVYSDLEGTRLTTGDMTVSRNTFTGQQNSAVTLGTGIVHNVSRASTVVLGSRTLQDNTVTSDPVAHPGCQGIYMPPDQITSVTDSSTVNTSDVTVRNNTISVDSIPLYLSGTLISDIGQMYWYDTVVITTGSTTISENTLASGSSVGIMIQSAGTGVNVYGESKITRGPLSITHNNVQSDGPACYVMESSSGSSMYEDSSLLLKGMNIENNTFISASDSAFFISRSSMGNGLQDNSSVTAQALNISRNTLKSPTIGIYLIDSSLGVGMLDRASYTGSSILIDKNSITPTTAAGIGNGIMAILSGMGSGNQGLTSSTVGDITLTNNRISDVTGMAVQLQVTGIGSSNVGAGRVAVGDIGISNNTIDTAAYGAFAQMVGLQSDSSTSLTVGKLTISGNNMTGISGFGIMSVYQAQNADPGSATLAIGAIQFVDNTIHGVTGSSNGIFFDVNTPTPGITFDTTSLSGNSVTGFQNGIFLTNNVKGAELSCNTLGNNVVAGLFIDSDEAFTAMNNAIVGNGKGVMISGPGTAMVKAERNWWGDADGPVACTSCNKIDAGGGSVDYDPWLISAHQMQCNRFPWSMFMPAFTVHRQ